MAMKCYTGIGNVDGNKLAVTARLSGVEIEFPPSEPFVKSKEFATKSPFKTLPVLDLPEGTLSKAHSAMKFIATAGGQNLYPQDNFKRAQVDEWLELCHDQLEVNLENWLGPIFGKRETDATLLKNAQNDVKKFLFTLNARLKSNNYVCGNEQTLADIAIACALVWPFRTIIDEKLRKPLANITKWFNTVSSLPQFVEVWGPVKMCRVPLNPPEPPKKEEKAAAPKKKEEEKKAPAAKPAPEKKANPDDVLPPSSFVMDDWKYLYANAPNKKETIPEFFNRIDKEGWSVWFMDYEKAQGEGKVLYMFENSRDGFLQRIESMRRWSFGVLGIYGDEPNLEIMACLLWRGQEVFPDLQDNPHFEFWKFRKADLDNDDDKKLIEEFWTSLTPETTVKGMPATSVKVWK